jgi:hypothetical protein
MADKVKLTPRDRALATAASIIEARAAEVERGYLRWKEKYPEDTLGMATERSAHLECVLLARLVKERMSPAGRAALAHTHDR